MIIEYRTSKYVTKEKQLEIEDTKNVFLQGTNPYDGLSTYFGIWENEECLVMATLKNDRKVSYEYSTNKHVHTECDIKGFLESSKNVKLISKEAFKKQLARINKILEI